MVKIVLGGFNVDVNELQEAIKKGEFTSALSLDKILEYAGLPPEPKPHRAINGAKREAEAFYRMRYGKPLFPEFKKFPLPEYLLKKSY